MKNKMRTRKSAVKRFKVTGTGKIIHRAHGARHLKSKKSKRALRSLKIRREVVGVFKSKINKMLGV